MTNKSAEEVEQEHLAVLGPTLGPLYHRLENECAWLQIAWAQYVELFGTTPERIELLNRAAGLFFRIVQDSVWDDILLRLCRLTDPPGISPKANLTVQRLPELVVDSATRASIQALVDKAQAASAFARDSRNRRIAHTDLALALEQGAEPLVPASRETVKAAISAVCAVVERIHLFYFDSALLLDHVNTEPTCALSLLYVIRDGVEVEEGRRTRLLEGNPRPEDIGPPRAV